MVDVTKTLREALAKLEVEKGRIDRQIAVLRNALRDGRGARGRSAAPRRRRRMSAAARAAVSRRMKAYWAKRRGEKGKNREK